MSEFHFSPRPNRANEIQWRDWGEDAFREAKDKNKPMLLAISAVWCHWCHVMDETSYSDDGVIKFINEHFVPVRVDNDQRPDVNARYNMGGWPTTAFLTPEGEILAGATYIPPEQMLEALPKVYTHYVSNGDEIAAKATELRQRRAAVQMGAPGTLSDEIFGHVLKAVVNQYDPLYGGFGEAPKFPHTDAIDLLLYAYRRSDDTDLLHMARKTLEMMYAGEVYDSEWNGFFRYATRRDWSEPHYEKMLEDNAGLLRNALSLHRVTREQEHHDIAAGTIAYVEWKLRDDQYGFFYGSQDADEQFYKLSKDYREGEKEPYIDRTCYTGWNAQMIGAYLEASWTLERPELAAEACRALDFLWDSVREPGKGMYRFWDSSPHILGLLTDQARTAAAALDAYEVTGDSKYFDRAIELAELMDAKFRDHKNGGYWDVWDDAEDVGLVRSRQKSVPENAVCADVMARLSHLTREDRWGEAARSTLETFAGGYTQLGHFAAGYAKQVDLWLHPPVEVNIVGSPPGIVPMHSVALALDVPARIVQVLDPTRDAERLAALSLPTEPAPAAYACVGTACSAPVTDPAHLIQTVHQMLQSGTAGISLGD